MAITKLTNLAQLRLVAEKVNSDFAKKTALSAVESQIENIDVPTNVSQLANDADYQNASQVEMLIDQKFVANEKPVFYDTGLTVGELLKINPGNVNYPVESGGLGTHVPDPEKTIFLARNEETGHYDMYIVMNNNAPDPEDVRWEWVLLDDTTVDLSGYVQKEDGMGLSQNSFTNEDKEKLTAIAVATDDEVTSMLDLVFA